MNTLAKLVDDTIHSLEKQNQPQPVKLEMGWVSDADRLGLPVVNEHDDKGAPLLKTDDILRRSYPNHARVK